MEKYDLQLLLFKIEEAERTLHRKLEKCEASYLENHSVEDLMLCIFGSKATLQLYDDLLTTIIFKVTDHHGDAMHTIPDDVSVFETDEYDNADDLVFPEKDSYFKHKEELIKDLRKAIDTVQVHEPDNVESDSDQRVKAALEKFGKSRKPQMVLNEDETFGDLESVGDDECGEKDLQNGHVKLENLIPENSRYWAEYLTGPELADVWNKVQERDDIYDSDEEVGEFVEEIKDAVLEKLAKMFVNNNYNVSVEYPDVADELEEFLNKKFGETLVIKAVEFRDKYAFFGYPKTSVKPKLEMEDILDKLIDGDEVEVSSSEFLDLSKVVKKKFNNYSLYYTNGKVKLFI